jgi:hypothetical protein
MAKQLSGFIALLLVSPFAWSQILDHESSFTIELDKTTGMWTMECELEADGIDVLDDHRINASVQYKNSSMSFALMIAQSYFDIFGDERTKSELTSGQFPFEAKKMGDRLNVGISLSWPAAGDPQGEGFICAINAHKLEGGVPVYGGIARMHVSQDVFSY